MTHQERPPGSRDEVVGPRPESTIADGDTKNNSESSTSESGVAVSDKEEGVDTEAAVAPPQPTAAAGDPEAERTNWQTFLVVLALCMALFLAALDVSIITTALPSISAHFHSSQGYVWVGGAYVLGNAAFVPTWGKISDIFGRKPVLLMAVSIFWIGSLLCAVSNSMAMLIAARAVQGVGGGGAVVLPNICVSDLFSIRKRGMYFGILGMVWAISSAVGPILGGVFTDRVSWRWCFYINLPLSGISLAILFFMLKLHNPRTPIRQGLAAIDWSGSLLVIGGTLMLLIGLEFGGVVKPWASATVICLVVFGVVTLGLFVVNEWKVATHPLAPLHLFRHRTSLAAYGISFFHSMAFMSGSYWLPLYFQGVLGVSSLMSGVYLLPFVVALSLVSATTGLIIVKTGKYKLLISIGLAINTLGLGLFIDLGPDRDWVKLALFQVVAGIGIGPNFQAPLIALHTNVAPKDIGSATAFFSFLRQIGTSVSVVVGGIIFNNEMQKQQTRLIAELGPELAAHLSGANATGSVRLVAALKGHDGKVARDAYWNAMQTMYIVYTCFAAAGFIVSLFIKQVRLSKDHTEHKTGLNTLREREDNTVNSDEKSSSQ
ncbi:Fungal trichothecene efflux pump (TRI12) [Geosmithia morbida]|uniref:Efflux pump dotC n=1 Tax=Geosmithia morbida TaxID=1094350 RepID=A0A9P4YYX0_9HYPO|nr:Fungal trichothecene efflux pump (TRI12) [Geosmithia morbida]KAF4125067.1 Fungal trichothecene efflux pump (TRI12) [Geosmithia morbida]